MSNLVCREEGWKSGSQANATRRSLLHSIRDGGGGEGYTGMQMKPQTVLVFSVFPFNTIKTLKGKRGEEYRRQKPTSASPDTTV